MTENLEDHSGVRIPPPLFFVLCLGIAFLLEHLFPIHPLRPPLTVRLIPAMVIWLLAGCMAANSFWVMHKHKTSYDPTKPTIKIVREGAFRFSRNPMYLSLLLLLIGAAVFTFSFWFLIAIPVLMLLFWVFAVKPEERYFSGKFGSDYQDYMAKVRRWI